MDTHWGGLNYTAMVSAWRMMQRLARGLVRLKAKIKAGSPYFSQNFILRFASKILSMLAWTLTGED
jgi:hypothetical protein